MTPTQFLIYGLAVWRVASLFVNETGPFHIFQWLRERAGIVHHDNGAIAVIPERFFPQVLSCVWCASLWIALPFAFFYGIAITFALSAFAILLETTIKRLQQ